MSEPTQQPPAPKTMQVPCTTVLVELTLRAGVQPQEIMPHMEQEVRDTVRLYLDGHIQQWFGMCDRPGVVFLFAARDAEAVQALMAELPLVKHQLVDLRFTRLGPLGPLRVLLQG